MRLLLCGMLGSSFFCVREGRGAWGWGGVPGMTRRPCRAAPRAQGVLLGPGCASRVHFQAGGAGIGRPNPGSNETPTPTGVSPESPQAPSLGPRKVTQTPPGPPRTALRAFEIPPEHPEAPKATQGRGEVSRVRGGRATPQNPSQGPRKIARTSSGSPRATPRAFETPRACPEAPVAPRQGGGPNTGSNRTHTLKGVSVCVCVCVCVCVW